MHQWLSAFLGTILIRVIAGGATLTGMKFLVEGLYVFAGFILVPFGAYLAWQVWEASKTDHLVTAEDL